MVYQLEKKYFPDQSLDKAFLDPEPAPIPRKNTDKKKRKDGLRDEKGLVFFDDDVEEKEKSTAVTEKKVEEFFKCLKKVPRNGEKKSVNNVEGSGGEPYLVKHSTELPPRWDGPAGTVILVDKPKGCCVARFFFLLLCCS